MNSVHPARREACALERLCLRLPLPSWQQRWQHLLQWQQQLPRHHPRLRYPRPAITGARDNQIKQI